MNQPTVVADAGGPATMGVVLPFRRGAARRRPLVADGGAAPDDLAAVIERAGRGDQDAFARLYDELAPLVFGVVRRVLRNPAQAEEVTQEVFVELWRIAPRYERAKGSPTAWASTIAHRRAVDRVRSEQRARDREERDAVEQPVPPDSVEDTVTAGAERAEVRDALAELHEDQRAAIELAYFGGHTYREVAELLGIPEGTAKARIRNGLIRLRSHLEPLR